MVELKWWIFMKLFSNYIKFRSSNCQPQVFFFLFTIFFFLFSFTSTFNSFLLKVNFLFKKHFLYLSRIWSINRPEWGRGILYTIGFFSFLLKHSSLKVTFPWIKMSNHSPCLSIMCMNIHYNEHWLCKEKEKLAKYRGNDDFYSTTNDIIDSWHYTILHTNGNNSHMYF